MNPKILTLLAVAALTAAPGLANATAAVHVDSGSGSGCSEEPYLREIVCRVNKALCALLCYYTTSTDPGAA